MNTGFRNISARCCAFALLLMSGMLVCHLAAGRELEAIAPNALSFVQRAKLAAEDATYNNLFGDCMAMSGDTIVVGAPNTDIGELHAPGAAYVFVRSGTMWQLQAKLIASDGRREDLFGMSVAIDGDTLIVGAPYADVGNDCGFFCDEGAAYVFTRNGTTWTQQQKIISPDPAPLERFAFKVKIQNNTAVISEHLATIGGVINRGMVNIYTRVAGTFGLQQRLTAANPALGLFGISLDLDGDTIAAGAFGDNTGGTVYVFTHNGTMWTQQQQLLASDAAPGKSFGISVALNGNTLVVGDNFDDINGNENQGSAYVFTRAGTLWTQRQKFTSGVGTDYDHFGEDVAVSGNTIVVGAPSERVGVNDYQGTVYVYAYNGASWTEQQKLVAADGIEDTLFGNNLFINGNMILVGAYNSASPGPTGETGAVYLFSTLSTLRAPFDFDGDGRTDIAVFRPSEGAWYILRSLGNEVQAILFGTSSDMITPADYDGDGRTDVAVFRPAEVAWYWLNSSNNTFQAAQFGAAGDVPVPADYDGDGRADIAVFRPSSGTWLRISSMTNNVLTTQFGTSGDLPAPADYDGDNRADLCVFRPTDGAWYRINSINNSFFSMYFGLNGDLPVPADFDGDGRADINVFRPSSGTWYRINSSPGCVVITRSGDKVSAPNGSLTGCFIATQFGLNGDRPTAGDYNGDGRADISVFRPSNNTWYRLNSQTTNSFTAIQFGTNGDRPVPAAFVP